VQPVPTAAYGDYNENAVVDAADYTLWRNQFGAAVLPYTSADGDGDGQIGANDYLVWKTNFGRQLTAPPGAASSTAAGQDIAHAETAIQIATPISDGASDADTQRNSWRPPSQVMQNNSTNGPGELTRALLEYKRLSSSRGADVLVEHAVHGEGTWAGDERFQSKRRLTDIVFGQWDEEFDPGESVLALLDR
jgi:hypothetical protein